MSCKWNETTCGPLCLASFTRHVLEIHPRCSIYQHFILFHCWIINNPLYEYVTFTLSIHWFMLICLFFFAIMSNAAMNIQVQVFYCGYMFSFLLSIYVGMELLSKSHGNSGFQIWGTSRLFSKVATPVYAPLAVYEGSSFCTPSLTLASVFSLRFMPH